MNMLHNDTAINNAETPDRRSPMSQRVLAFVLIALPCLMIAFGVLTGTLIAPDASNIIYGTGGYLPTAIIVVLLVLSYSLFKNNPRMRRAALWTFRSYAQSIAGLDEREKVVIDQAFRSSYRIISLACVLALACMLLNVQTVHLPYHPRAISLLYIMYGVFGVLIYLPAAIVAWKEDI